ncbi:hypothetical protein N7G274_002662 [Stereocaulon virgatum]|uniref:Alanine racemase N-terminal domain-containing protein n=1 Tax=Stereocaulon virgatum TaxID=373712 RepID=A0ABR4AGF2_9LECA
MVLETSSPSKTDLRGSKTIKATLLQIGNAVDGAKLVVSTMTEAEHLADLLQNLSARGRSPNVLYGVPLAPSQIHRLAMLRNKIGPHSVSVLVDNSSQLGSAHIFKQATGVALQVFVKVDLGYHRAGLDYTSKAFDSLIKDIIFNEEHGSATLIGFYTHAGHSYGGESDIAAVRLLMEEIKGLYKAAIRVRPRDHARGQSQPRYILSVGATPTATSVQSFLP